MTVSGLAGLAIWRRRYGTLCPDERVRTTIFSNVNLTFRGNVGHASWVRVMYSSGESQFLLPGGYTLEYIHMLVLDKLVTADVLLRRGVVR